VQKKWIGSLKPPGLTKTFDLLELLLKLYKSVLVAALALIAQPIFYSQAHCCWRLDADLLCRENKCFVQEYLNDFARRSRHFLIEAWPGAPCEYYF
jgi:hypothetical protein